MRDYRRRQREAAMVVTFMDGSYRARLSKDMLLQLGITQADFNAQTYSIEMSSYGGTIFITRTKKGGMPLKGSYTAPIIYGDALYTIIDEVFGFEYLRDKILIFPEWSYTDGAYDEMVAMITIMKYKVRKKVHLLKGRRKKDDKRCRR